MRDGAHWAERDGASGGREELWAVSSRWRGLPSVGSATNRDDDAAGVHAKHSQRSGHRDRRRRRSRHRDWRRRREPWHRGGGRRGRGSPRRDGRGREQCRGRKPICAAPLRHDLHAVHVRQGQPDPARARVSAGVHPAAGAPAATSAERPCQHSTSPSGNPAATSSWTFAV